MTAVVLIAAAATAGEYALVRAMWGDTFAGHARLQKRFESAAEPAQPAQP